MFFCISVMALALPFSSMAFAQGPATYVTNAEIEAATKSMASSPVGDQLVRVAGINNGEYNVGVAVVHRAKAASIQSGLEHSQITEIYQIISGYGTMVSGGTMGNAKDLLDAHILEVVGPSKGGAPIVGGQSRKVGPGDVIIIPPNTVHGWSEIATDLAYLVVRVDPHKVLHVK
jgi:oxalate decarboxylase/phosphoglucose isomerase-like protein (cupin superfamily)